MAAERRALDPARDRPALLVAGDLGRPARGPTPQRHRLPRQRRSCFSAFLGLALTFAGSAFYDYYEGAPRLWGLSPVEDQNLGGVLMTAEQSIVFLAAITWQLLRLLREEDAREQRQRETDAELLRELDKRRRRA